MPNVADALHGASRCGIDRLDAQLLLSKVLNQPRTWVLAHDDAVLDDEQHTSLLALLKRRAGGEPLAYLLGEKEFYGSTLRVTPDVLVPRPESEALVDWALECLDRKPNVAEVVDLGTGSGALALAVASARPHARVCATDTSAAALAVARSNGARLGIGVQWLQGDWWSVLAGRRFHVVLANPPYVADGDVHLPALSHEPQIALRARQDGLHALQAIIGGAPRHLEAGGWLLLEHGHEQGHAVRSMFEEGRFEEIETRDDLSGRGRCTGGRRPL